jgi:hypothetical protein
MSIITEIKEEIQSVRREPSSKDMTILALIFLILPGAYGCFQLFLKSNANGYIWIGLGVALGACRLIPPLFRLIYHSWVGFSVVLGYFVSRILLTVIFFLVLLPTGLIMRLTGKDPMERQRDPEAGSYWIPRTQEPDTSIERYEKQF